jgi:hypothetical protein
MRCFFVVPPHHQFSACGDRSVACVFALDASVGAASGVFAGSSLMEVSHLSIIDIFSLAGSCRDLTALVIRFLSSLSSYKLEFICRSYDSFGLLASNCLPEQFLKHPDGSTA